MDARSRKIQKLKISILQFKFPATAALKKLRSKVLLLAGDSVPIFPANWPSWYIILAFLVSLTFTSPKIMYNYRINGTKHHRHSSIGSGAATPPTSGGATPTHSTSKGAPPPAPGSTSVGHQIYRALYDYSPAKSDELSLRKGELYIVIEKCKDGWYKGSSVARSVGVVRSIFIDWD